MRNYKHKAKFISTARCLFQRDEKKKIIKASLSNLDTLLPNDFESNPDLLPIVGNAAVVNIANKNGHLISSDIALKIYKKFINKGLNVEHDGSNFIGHFTSSNLTTFSENYEIGEGSEILSEDPKPDDYTPFNICLGGFIYASYFPEIADRVLESADPESPNYMDISYSWELMFDSAALMIGTRHFGDKGNKIITDEEEQQAFSGYLIENSGKGKMRDGSYVSKMPIFLKNEDGTIDENSIYASAAALTFYPAAEVKGLRVGMPKKEKSDNIVAELSTKDIINKIEVIDNKLNKSVDNLTKSIAQIAPSQKIIENNISQNKKTPVTKNIKPMKIKSFAELKLVKDNPEVTKDLMVADIVDLCEDMVRVANDQYKEEIGKEQKAVAAATDAANTAKAELEKVNAELAANKAELEKIHAGLKDLEQKNKDLEQKQIEAANRETFQLRMAHLDEVYEFTDDDRKIVASDIEGLDEDGFKKYEAKAAVIFRDRKKGEAKPDVTVDPTKMVASIQPNPTVVPNAPTTEPGEDEKLTKLKNAFSLGEGFTLESNNKRKNLSKND